MVFLWHFVFYIRGKIDRIAAKASAMPSYSLYTWKISEAHQWHTENQQNLMKLRKAWLQFYFRHFDFNHKNNK